MSNSRLWINQLVKYLIISHDYAQISFVNASREKLADSVWMVNPNSPFMLIHLSGNPQSLNIARKQQIMNEAQSSAGHPMTFGQLYLLYSLLLFSCE